MRSTRRHSLWIGIVATILLACGALLNAQTDLLAQTDGPGLAVSIPTVESDHPYENDTNKFWTIPNIGRANAARIHFSRIELEDGVDQIFIYDANDTLIQEITTSAPNGMWSDPVPGASIKVVLKSDGSGRFWGFAIDQLEPVNYPTIHYSPHPYPNNAKLERTFVNNAANPEGTRVRFDRIELEDGVDYIVIYDLNNTPYQWITGNHPNGLTSKAVPGAGIKVQLVSDGSGRAWGYNLVAVESGSPTGPDAPPQRTTLAESDHPYVTDFSRTWIITNPDPNALSSKIHFSRIEIGGGDKLEVLDANDTVIQTFGERTIRANVWSDYVPGRIVKVRLTTSWYEDWWGFRVDNIVNSVSNPGLAQSDHPYITNITKVWTITNPNVNASRSRVHFSRIEIGGGDKLEVLDANDTVIQTFGERTIRANVWSDYVPGRIVKVRLTTAWYENWWGFRVDAIEPSSANPVPPAGINGIYVQINAPGDVYLNGKKLFRATAAGEYRIPLAAAAGVVIREAWPAGVAPGTYSIRIEYATSEQTIEVRVGATGGIEIVYLPLVRR